jgi:hypothetical protein
MDNHELPKTISVTIYLYMGRHGELHGLTTEGMENQGWTLLSTETKTITVPEANPVVLELDQLSRRETVLRSKYDEEMGNIKGRRAELLALEWQREGDA